MAEIIAKCPACGGDIVENAKAYGCRNWKEEDGGCKVTIWKNQLEKLGKKSITKQEAKQLLGGTGKTSKKVKLVSPKTGKEFETYLVLDENYKIQFQFD
ncbi:hypothetical protein JK635_07780 [Neobacillus sp. YIM B02564]|uniref:DNA topoisomerase III n=1 Tax=Neobacillus paridis TaxID=2803862 RepID=A0ABS1TN09_9BACI|nr:topoisomerase C-terminal repeat-containing protein [Neobacillus paridis]MBL4952109.1 hypothetical protein [Neobacillus paridis]